MTYVRPSILQSFHHSVMKFFGIGSLVFSETQHGVRGLCGVVHDRARILENKYILHSTWAKDLKFFLILKNVGKFSH